MVIDDERRTPVHGVTTNRGVSGLVPWSPDLLRKQNTTNPGLPLNP